MSKKDCWGSYKLQSILEQLLHRNIRTQGVQYPAATIVSRVRHDYSMQQGLRFLSTNSKPWTKLDAKMVLNNGGGKGKVQQPLSATTTPRHTIASWLRWIVGSILSLALLPFWKQNWGKLQRIEEAVRIDEPEIMDISVEAESVMEEVEKVAGVVERVAIVAEKVSEDVADELSDNGKLKETLVLVERVSKVAAKDAQLTKDFIHKVDALKHDMEDLETLVEPVIEKISKHG